MKKSIRTVMAGLLAVPVLALSVSAVSPILSSTVSAVDNGGTTIGEGADTGKGTSNVNCLFTNTKGGSITANPKYCANGIFTTITNTALFIIGAISVIMLIYGGIRYTISMGDAKNVEAAKNTILYAIIGIVVALLAFAIVNFVIGALAQ